MSLPSSVKKLGVNAFDDGTVVMTAWGKSGIPGHLLPGFGSPADRKNFKIAGDTLVQYTGDDESVMIPPGVTEIEKEAFSGNSNLMIVMIPEGVKAIGGAAFQHCHRLEEVTIPDSVTKIGIAAFSWCQALMNVTIGKRVTYIGEMAFFGCGELASVTIPRKVTEIGAEAFADCGSLTSSSWTRGTKRTVPWTTA